MQAEIMTIQKAQPAGWPSRFASATLHIVVLGLIVWPMHARKPVRVVPEAGFSSLRTTLEFHPSRRALLGEKAEEMAALKREPPKVKTVVEQRQAKSLLGETREMAARKEAEKKQTSATTVMDAAATQPAGSPLKESNGIDWSRVKIALQTFAPSPKVDVSRLPRGKEGDVAMDVTISAQGQVVDVKLLQTVGYGFDQVAMDTVKTWRFQPATEDGQPIESIQEVRFHYVGRG